MSNTPPTLDPARTWLISDTHFGHKNIIDFCKRPPDVEQIIMEEWATYVGADDTLLHLGDLSYKGNAWFKNMVAKHLTGRRKLLIAGNHDKARRAFYRDSGFKLTAPFSIEYGSERHQWGEGQPYVVSFSHYPSDEPLPAWETRVHGHIHNNGYTRDAYVPFLAQHINLSCEQTKYRPVRLDHLLNGYLFGEYPGKGGQADPVGAISADSIQPKRGYDS